MKRVKRKPITDSGLRFPQAERENCDGHEASKPSVAAVERTDAGETKQSSSDGGRWTPATPQKTCSPPHETVTSLTPVVCHPSKCSILFVGKMGASAESAALHDYVRMCNSIVFGRVQEKRINYRTTEYPIVSFSFFFLRTTPFTIPLNVCLNVCKRHGQVFYRKLIEALRLCRV